MSTPKPTPRPTHLQIPATPTPTPAPASRPVSVRNLNVSVNTTPKCHSEAPALMSPGTPTKTERVLLPQGAGVPPATIAVESVVAPESNPGVPPEPQSACISYRTKDINVVALPAAIYEYEKVLMRRLAKPLMNFFARLYEQQVNKVKQFNRQSPDYVQVERALRQAREHADLLLFQETLRGIPKWLTMQVDPAVAQILGDMKLHKNGDTILMETLKILFISRAVLMASIRPGSSSDDTSINIELPTLNVYLHQVLSLAAEELFKYPSLLKRHRNDTEITLSEKRQRFKEIMREAVSDAIHDVFPYDHIVNTYLSEAVNGLEFAPKQPQPEQTTQPLQPALIAPVVPTTNNDEESQQAIQQQLSPKNTVALPDADAPIAVAALSPKGVKTPLALPSQQESEPQPEQPVPDSHIPDAAELGLEEDDDDGADSASGSGSETGSASESESGSGSDDNDDSSSDASGSESDSHNKKNRKTKSHGRHQRHHRHHHHSKKSHHDEHASKKDEPERKKKHHRHHDKKHHKSSRHKADNVKLDNNKAGSSGENEIRTF